jgi:predicted AlkP superfamily pyrophosphatase or phosphodiesterase
MSRLIIGAAILSALWVYPLPGAPPPRTRLLLISIDGLMPSSYTAAQSGATTLRALAARGAWATGVTGVWPTNTRPSHTSLVTGVSPGVHGIVDNYLLDPEGQLAPPFNWFARDIKVPTLISSARAAGLKTAALMWPVSVGLDTDHLVPTFRWGPNPRDLTLLRALSTPGLLDEFERSIGAPFAWPPTDSQRADLATFIIRTHQPDVLLLYFGTLDAYQHTYGPDAQMTDSALRDIDGLIGRTIASLDSQKLLDDTFVAVVSDHGYVDVDHAVGPNTAFRQEGLIETDVRGRITRWDAYSHGTGGSSLVYLRNRSDQELLARARRVLDALKADPRAGIDRILDHDEVVAAGADPEAAFGIAMQLGYTLTEERGTLFGPPYIHAMHGYPPGHAAMNASFIITGPGLAGTGNIGMVRMTQIAPTLARLLGVSLSPNADAPIDTILRASAR